MQRRSCHFLAARPIASFGSSWGRKVNTNCQAGCHSAVGSIERYARDASALGQQLFLSPEVSRYRVRRTEALMIKISAARSRQLVLARGKPRLGYAPLMKVVRC